MTEVLSEIPLGVLLEVLPTVRLGELSGVLSGVLRVLSEVLLEVLS